MTAAVLQQAEPGTYQVLAIDDAPLSLDSIRRALGDQFRVLATTEGRQGLVLAQRHHPDLIVLDVMMPEMDGFEVCRHLQDNPATRDIPVIFVTGLGSEGDELRGFGLGAVDFVTKPVEPVILQARVRTQLELAASRRALARAKEHLERERELIAEVVLGLRREAAFCERRLDWHTWSQDPAGGDLVLSALRPNGDEHVLVGDFTGHGLTAAIGTPLVSHLFYSLTAADRPLADIVTEINDVLVQRLPVQLFMASAAVCIPAGSAGALVWSFGNPDLLHRDAAGNWQTLRANQLPMGITFAPAPFTPRELPLAAGEALFLLTDGLYEAEGQDGRMLGIDRVREIIARHHSMRSALLEVRSLAAQPALLDDMTLLRIDGGALEPPHGETT